MDGIIGNSSSGLLESPSFFKGTINIGDRQKGRLKASSIIDCEPIKKDIEKAINRLFSKEFKDTLKDTINPYGNGSASNKVVDIIQKINLNESSEEILKKKFYDLETSSFV